MLFIAQPMAAGAAGDARSGSALAPSVKRQASDLAALRQRSIARKKRIVMKRCDRHRAIRRQPQKFKP
jgi:hypothetical protein